MKINSLLLLASLAALATNASAAQIDSEVVVLPKYVVASPRYQPVEQNINANLNELRQQARQALTLAPAFPALKAQARQGAGLAGSVRDAKIVHVAKS